MIKIKKGLRRVTRKEWENNQCEKKVPYDGCSNLYSCDRPATYFVDGAFRCGLHVPKRFKIATNS